MIRGIDVSNHQGHINWPQVAASGREFAIIKASGGQSFRDPWAARYADGARAAGLEVGYYHFAFDSDPGSPELEAANFLRALRDIIQPGEPIALDVETGSGDLSSWVGRWMLYVQNALGIKPWLYTSPAFINEHGLAVPALADNGLWLASWGLSSMPRAPRPWELLACWQDGVAPAGAVTGVVGECDTDQFNGDRQQFRRYGLPETSVGPDPEPGVTEPIATTIERQLAAIETAIFEVRRLLSS